MLEENTGAESPASAVNYFNRDLSWIDFNERVLEEGLRKDLPLLERFRFLSIVSSNFDEFFMVRVAALKRALRSGAAEPPPLADPSGLSPAEQLKGISEKAHAITRRLYACLKNEIFPGLAEGGLALLRPDSWTVPQMDHLESVFIGQVYPLITPLRIEEDKPLPFIGSRSINAVFLLVPETAAPENPMYAAGVVPPGKAQPEQKNTAVQIAVAQIPPAQSRIIWLPEEHEKLKWALLDDLMLVWGGYLFPGFRVKESMLFKVNRNADFSVDERRDEDFIEAMEEVLEGREKSEAVRMVYSPGSAGLRDELAKRFSLDGGDLYEVDGPFNTGDLLELTNVAGSEELQEKAWKIHPVPGFSEDVPVWDRISQGDVMLHLPYQSFDPVIRFFQEAAADPHVIAIKTALYRTGGAGFAGGGSSSAVSPVVRALEQAALNGKQVTALVELKARFDEERNISWANRLEKAGVIVVYGLSRLKVHAKITMVFRREHERIKRYVHLSTGNYNDKTAKLYEDICIFTCRDDIAYDAGLLFNMLTGYSDIQTMTRLVIAPTGLKDRLLELIDREAKRSSQKYPGKIMVKLNALTDTDMINALYRASRAGVKIFLCVRGICTLIPGLPELSENIRVISVIDHYLEHSRIYFFANGGAEELYLSSADWMPRNLRRRVELMFPVLDEKIRAELREALNAYFRDNCQARSLKADGTWTRLSPPAGEKPLRAQKDMLSRAARKSGNPWPVKKEFIVRRGPPVER
ncbi:MAG: polyphosphate kinase 1 [Treponema sp.]|jgi:polyphosphate kinase|nr:polyphosphate kinase 1 [Treponema sp.]